MNAKELWNFKYKAPILGIELCDINNDKNLEIIAFTKNGMLLFLSLDGKLLHKEVVSKNSPLWHMRIQDIDNDGRYELVLGGIDGILRIFKCKATYNLDLLWKHKFNSSISGILIEDINHDGRNELITFSLDKTLRVLNPLDGKLIWGQVFEDGIGDAIVFKNNKKINNKEILACGNDGTIRSYEGNNGKLLWFKRYSDKMRVITYMNTIKGQLILSGGDDKKLHILDRLTQNEIRTLQFNNYVWKCVSYPFPILNNVLISSYSFAFIDESPQIKNIEFTSKMVCIDENFDIKWELNGYNVECFQLKKSNTEIFIIVGTTIGRLLVIEEKTGKILLNKKHDSCINMSQIWEEKRLLFSCHDDGTIIAHHLENI